MLFLIYALVYMYINIHVKNEKVADFGGLLFPVSTVFWS